MIKLWIYPFQQVKVGTQLLCLPTADVLLQGIRMDINLYFLRHHLLRWLEEVEALLVNIIHALETSAIVDRPRERAHTDLQLLLQFVQQVEGILGLTVHLIHKDDHGRISHTTYLHQLQRLSLHALGTVYHDDDAVHCRQRAIRIFGKVLVTRGIQDIDLIVMIVELHHAGSHGDATLFLYVHPVAGGCLAYLVTLHGTSHLNLSAEEQQFLSERCLTSIWVCYDGKCAPTGYFVVHLSVSYFFWGAKLQKTAILRKYSIDIKFYTYL